RRYTPARGLLPCRAGRTRDGTPAVWIGSLNVLGLWYSAGLCIPPRFGGPASTTTAPAQEHGGRSRAEQAQRGGFRDVDLGPGMNFQVQRGGVRGKRADDSPRVAGVIVAGIGDAVGPEGDALGGS